LRSLARLSKRLLQFVADMGEPPSANMTIERIDNDGPYSPDNCIWADRRAQALNRRRTIWITIGDVTLCVQDWARRLGVDYASLRGRAKTLNSYKAAIESYEWWPRGKRVHIHPTSNTRWVTVDGETLTLADWRRRLGVSSGGIQRRAAVYGTMEAAIRSFTDKPLRKVKMPKRKIAA
jgi:hypothetical protein